MAYNHKTSHLSRKKNISFLETYLILDKFNLRMTFQILLINLTMDFFFPKLNCFSKLSKLTDLNLRDNNFDNKILRSLGALPVLKFLDLSFNNMWPLSGQSTCISKFFFIKNTMKKFRYNWKSCKKYLLLSTFTLFVFKSTIFFNAMPNAFDMQMIVVVSFQYPLNILSKTFVHSKIKMCLVLLDLSTVVLVSIWYMNIHRWRRTELSKQLEGPHLE